MIAPVLKLRKHQWWRVCIVLRSQILDAFTSNYCRWPSSTKLYNSAHGCERLARSCYMKWQSRDSIPRHLDHKSNVLAITQARHTGSIVGQKKTKKKQEAHGL